MTKILVTGANGFVGRELMRQLSAVSQVMAIDSLQYGPARIVDQQGAPLEVAEIDIRDQDAVAAILSRFKPDVIIHLAALHFIPACEGHPVHAVDVNVTGTVNLLAQAAPGTRFIFASSGAVYAPDDAPLQEDSSALMPADIYGLTKLQCEAYVKYFAQRSQLSAVIVRLFNVVGPGETNTHILPEVVAQLKHGATKLSLGNIWPKRDYIDVEDAARGFASVALSGSVGVGQCETVNLGTGKQYSVAELLDMLKTVSGIAFEVHQDPAKVRAVDRPFLGADIRKIQENFGWTPSRTLEDAISRMWASPSFASKLAEHYGL